MDDLIAFLKARYEEEIATAVRLGDADGILRPWEIGGDPHLRIAKARVVTEVMSKRQLLEASAVTCPPVCGPGGEHAFTGSCALRRMGPVTEADGERWVHDDTGARFTAPPVTPEWTIRVLALPYAGHPDYRAEWRP